MIHPMLTAGVVAILVTLGIALPSQANAQGLVDPRAIPDREQPPVQQPPPPPREPITVQVVPPQSPPPPPPEPCGRLRLNGPTHELQYSTEDFIVLEFWVDDTRPQCVKGLSFDVLGAPGDAVVVERAEDGHVRIELNPKAKHIGHYEIQVRATQGEEASENQVRLIIEEEWETYWMPGIQYTMLAPADRDGLGMYHGVSVEYLFAAWIHRNENRGPSHGRFYANVDLLRSTKPEADDLLLYHLGLNLSVERNPTRSFLIPFFGIEAGGGYQRKYGNFAHFTPLAGFHVIGTQNVFLNVTGGYLYPTTALEEIRGARVKAGLNVSFW